MNKKLLTKVQKDVLKVLNDHTYWKPPSSRTIAEVLGKKGHMGIEWALRGLRDKEMIDEDNKPNYETFA